jgi:hypothetical protein
VSAREPDLWIVVNNWDRFQHYGNRRPVWIKAYLDLTHSDDYLQLTGHRRGILHGLWLEYASTRCQLRADTVSLTRRLNLRVTTADLGALIEAGFIDFVASKPLADGYQEASLEVEVEKERTKTLEDQPRRAEPAKAEEPACPLCGITYPRWQRIREHLLNVHVDTEDEADRLLEGRAS